MKISVTMLSSYLYCPRKLFLQRVLAVEEPPKESLVLGSLRHEIYDFINQTEEKIVTSVKEKIQYDELLTKYKTFYSRTLREKIIKNKSKIREVNADIVDVFKRTWPLILNEAETRTKNIFNFIQKHNIFGKELWEKLTPKIISEKRVESNKLQLRGIIDRIEVYENGYVPVELKTGKMPKEGVWPGHKIQIAAYAMMIEETFNTNVKEGFVRYLDTKVTRQIAMNPFMKEEIINLVKEVQDLLNNQNIPNYCENKNKCTHCGVRETCYNEPKVTTLLSEIQ
jgi:CRISPR-associated exonuclease Cas4